MTQLAAKIQTMLAQRDKGATAVEYGLMVALIAAVVIIGVTALGNTSGNTFNDVSTKI
ncbi:Flp family type IVb pilin [Terrabacter sp. AAH1]